MVKRRSFSTSRETVSELLDNAGENRECSLADGDRTCELLVTGCRDHMVVTRHACQVWDVKPHVMLKSVDVHTHGTKMVSATSMSRIHAYASGRAVLIHRHLGRSSLRKR
jgi:hypothetical protein